MLSAYFTRQQNSWTCSYTNYKRSFFVFLPSMLPLHIHFPNILSDKQSEAYTYSEKKKVGGVLQQPSPLSMASMKTPPQWGSTQYRRRYRSCPYIIERREWDISYSFLLVWWCCCNCTKHTWKLQTFKNRRNLPYRFLFFSCATYEASHKMLMRSFIKLISAFISKQTYGNTNIHTTYKSHCSFRHILQLEFQSLALQVSDVLLLLQQEIFL